MSENSTWAKSLENIYSVLTSENINTSAKFNKSSAVLKIIKTSSDKVSIVLWKIALDFFVDYKVLNSQNEDSFNRVIEYLEDFLNKLKLFVKTYQEITVEQINDEMQYSKILEFMSDSSITFFQWILQYLWADTSVKKMNESDYLYAILVRINNELELVSNFYKDYNSYKKLDSMNKIIYLVDEIRYMFSLLEKTHKNYHNSNCETEKIFRWLKFQKIR